MNALADALVAAQRRALTAIEKQYAAGKMERDDAIQHMNLIGLNDLVDQDKLLHALDTISVYGAALPTEPSGEQPAKPQNEQASEKQRAFIQKLLADKGHALLPPPDLNALSKTKAHELIELLRSGGAYNVDEWSVPF